MSPPHYSAGNPVHEMRSALFESGCIPIDRPDDVSWAMPQAARAADASHSSLLRVSTIGGIAIAAFAALYFAFELGRGVL
jgi:hypothetical protein